MKTTPTIPEQITESMYSAIDNLFCLLHSHITFEEMVSDETCSWRDLVSRCSTDEFEHAIKRLSDSLEFYSTYYHADDEPPIG